MKALLTLLVLLVSLTQAMRRVVTTERRLTPLNELYLLAGTNVNAEDFFRQAKKEVFTRPELREALAKYLHDKLRLSGYFHYEKKSDYE
jgi:thioredoxin-related protein